MRILNKILGSLIIMGSSALTTAWGESTNLTVNVTATIQPGTCYFNQENLTFNFGQVYPANIMNSDPTLRPKAADQNEVATAKLDGNIWERHTACDIGSTKMKFSINAEGNQAMGADGENVITLQTSASKSGNPAQGFGIAVYKVDNNTETPISIGTATDMGNQGDFTLRARLVPLQNKSVADITGGYIYATAMLNIIYE